MYLCGNCKSDVTMCACVCLKDRACVRIYMFEKNHIEG